MCVCMYMHIYTMHGKNNLDMFMTYRYIRLLYCVSQPVFPERVKPE